MSSVLLVGVGGFAGAILRYLLSEFVQSLAGKVRFPHGTFAVNIVGCLLIGILSHLAESQTGVADEIRLMLMVGLLGAFTTFSAFSNDTLNLLRDQKLLLAGVNIGAHVIVGLAAVLLGRLAIIAIAR